MTDLPTDPTPTARDLTNASYRQAVAAKAEAEYRHAELLAYRTLGIGWHPWMKISLLDSDYHQTGNTQPYGVAFKVYRGDQRLTDRSVFIREMPDGQVRQAASYEELFPELHEPHPTRTLEIKGQTVPAPRWTLCWSSLDLYKPRSAEALAKARATRETRKEEKADRQWVEDNPLWAFVGLTRQDEEGERSR